jgi:ABC-type nickel/cobalt efflux system permease component RcnA
MNYPDHEEAPVRSLALRRALMVAFLCLLLAGFVPMLLLYQGLINAEALSVSDSFLYVGSIGASIVGLIMIFVVWRCPGCGAYLGKHFTPPMCAACGTRFR